MSKASAFEPSNKVSKFLRFALAFLFYPGYVEYYELDPIFKRSAPFPVYDLLEADQGILLDIGCDKGNVFEILSREVFPVGVEISRKWAKRIKKHKSAILAPTQNLPLRNQTIDFVVVSKILEHLQNKI